MRGTRRRASITDDKKAADVGEPEADMDTYGGIVAELVDWVANRSGAILMMSATLPAALLLKGGRLPSLGALAVLVGAVTLISFGIETLAGTLIVILANSLLVSVALLSTRKRLTQVEDRLAVVMSALGDLEVAEERRQTYGARQSSTSRLHPSRKRAAATMEQNVPAVSTENPGRETQVIPGPPWQELHTPDPRLGSAVPVSAGRDPGSRKASKKAAPKLNGSAGDGLSQL